MTKTPDSAPDPGQARRVEELARRIAEIESLDDAAFGRFTRWDWGLCVAFALAIPAFALWWAAA